MTHNDVFLEALEIINLAQCRSVGENTCGFLEGCGRDKGLCLKRRLGNTEEHWLTFSRHATSIFDMIIGAHEHEAVNLLTPEEIRVPWIGDTDLLEHLRDDHLNVLIINGNTLEAVDLLNLSDQVILNSRGSENVEHFVRIGTTFSEVLTTMDQITDLNG